MTVLRALGAVLLAAASVGCGGAAPTASPGQPTSAATGQPSTAPTTAGATPTATGQATATAAPTASGQAGGILPDITRIATGETPSGWKEVTSSDGACRIAAPADWDSESLPGAAIAPGFGAQAMVSNDPIANWGSWDAYIDTAKTAYFGPDKQVLVETDEVFVMVSGPSTPDASFLVGRNLGETACGVLMTVTGAGLADFLAAGQQVLYTLAATS